MPGLAKQRQRGGRINAENIDWSPAFCGAPGGAFSSSAPDRGSHAFCVDLETRCKDRHIIGVLRDAPPSESLPALCGLPPNAGFAGKSDVSV